MARIVQRSDWGAEQPRSRTPWNVRDLRGVAVHWFGRPTAASSHAGCPALLRAVQRAHKSGEFVDIAYNHAVCPHGEVYELRGFDTQTGANGTTRANREYAAVVYMAGVGDPLTQAGKRGLTSILREYRQRGVGADVKPHGYFTGSSCPGPAVKEWLTQGGYKVDAPKAKRLPKAFWTWARWYLGHGEFKHCGARNPVSRPDVPKRIPRSWWKRLKARQ